MKNVISNQKGQSLIGVMVAMGIMGILMMALCDITLMMIKSNTTALANSDILAYINQVRTNIQSPDNATSMLKGQPLTGEITVKDPILGTVMSAAGFKQQPNDAWKIQSVVFEGVLDAPIVNVKRMTLVVYIQKDPNRTIGGSSARRVVGDVYCLVATNIIVTCSLSAPVADVPRAPAESVAKMFDFDADPKVCENFQIKPRCPTGQVVKVVSSSYGGNCAQVPSNYGQITVESLCNGKASCDFTAGNANNCTGEGVFVDPSVGCPKSFHMVYTCVAA